MSVYGTKKSTLRQKKNVGPKSKRAGPSVHPPDRQFVFSRHAYKTWGAVSIADVMLVDTTGVVGSFLLKLP